MPQGKYFLNWPSYSDHLRSTFRSMLETGDFSDVTLVFEDRKQFRAHRNILAAGSPMLMDILQITHGIQPVIFLKGVQGSDLETILQFLYFGEATLYEDRINAFLDVSKILEIQDLFNSISSDEILQHRTVDDFPSNSGCSIFHTKTNQTEIYLILLHICEQPLVSLGSCRGLKPIR